MKRFAWLFVTIIVGIVIFSAFKQSLFGANRERVNVVFYRATPQFFSLGLSDNLHYASAFYPDYPVSVPGGYGTYRIGALGKLVALEKKPEIFKKAFSVASGSFVEYYFFPKSDQVYYGKEKSDISVPSVAEVLFDQSNANFFDRMFFTMQFFGKRRGDFSEPLQGYYYQKQLRDEHKNVRIIFSKSDLTAQTISKIIEGNGIRVADITQEKSDHCSIAENGGEFSATAHTLARFFGCSLTQRDTGVYDILFTLGEVEKQWEVNQ